MRTSSLRRARSRAARPDVAPAEPDLPGTPQSPSFPLTVTQHVKGHVLAWTVGDGNARICFTVMGLSQACYLVARITESWEAWSRAIMGDD